MNNMRKLTLVVLITLAMVGMAAAALSNSNLVGQRGRMFSVEVIRVRRGESVTFVNDDTVPHNIMSSTQNNSFDMGSQSPGTAVPVSFDEIGTVHVVCAIHPRMRMSIEVVE